MKSWALLVIGLALVACPTTPTSVVGTWRSLAAELTVTERGASIQFGCATGTIDAPILLNARGEFSANGTYTQLSGVAPPPNSPPPTPQPTVYSGRVSGNNLSFSGRFQNGTTTGTITVVRDGPAQVIYCA